MIIFFIPFARFLCQKCKKSRQNLTFSFQIFRWQSISLNFWVLFCSHKVPADNWSIICPIMMSYLSTIILLTMNLYSRIIISLIDIIIGWSKGPPRGIKVISQTNLVFIMLRDPRTKTNHDSKSSDLNGPQAIIPFWYKYVFISSILIWRYWNVSVVQEYWKEVSWSLR